MGAEVLAHFSKVLLEVNVSFLVISIELWNEELLEHVQIHDTGNGRLHEEEGPINSFCAEGAKYVHLWAVINMLQEDTWIFAAPDPAVDYRSAALPMKVTLNHNYLR
jgi:hypothetical protein